MCGRLRHGVWIVCVVAACARSDTDLDRSVRLLPMSDVPHGPVSATLLGQTRTVMEILSSADTAGLGRHLHAEFAWHRYPESTGSPTRLRGLRSDAHWLERVASALPLLPTPLPAQLQLRMRGDSSAIVLAYDCMPARDCDARPPVILNWRLTAGGWKAVAMRATAEAR